MIAIVIGFFATAGAAGADFGMHARDEKDVRLWNMISCAGGATGILYPRWRPLLDGPLFGAFGPMAMDGSVTPRAEMAGLVSRWANSHPEIWQSRPVRWDIGIVFAPESELFNYVQQGSTAQYAASARGASPSM